MTITITLYGYCVKAVTIAQCGRLTKYEIDQEFVSYWGIPQIAYAF